MNIQEYEDRAKEIEKKLGETAPLVKWSVPISHYVTEDPLAQGGAHLVMASMKINDELLECSVWTDPFMRYQIDGGWANFIENIVDGMVHAIMAWRPKE